MGRVGLTLGTQSATMMEVTETAAGGVRKVGGTRSRLYGPGATHTGAEALLVFAGSANASEIIKAGQWQVGTLLEFGGLVRVAAISGSPTARLRVRLGTAQTTADTLIYDSNLRTVADEDILSFRGHLMCLATGASGTLDGVMHYQFSAADALTVAATEFGQDLAGTTAGTWGVTVDTTVDHYLTLFGVTDGVGTDIVPRTFWTKWHG